MLNATYAMVITSSHFTESAKNVIQQSPKIRGMEIEGLKKKVREHFRKEIKKPKEGTLFEKIKHKITWATKPEPVEVEFNVKEGKIEQIPYKPRSGYQKRYSRNTRTSRTTNRRPRTSSRRIGNSRNNRRYRKS